MVRLRKIPKIAAISPIMANGQHSERAWGKSVFDPAFTSKEKPIACVARCCSRDRWLVDFYRPERIPLQTAHGKLTRLFQGAHAPSRANSRRLAEILSLFNQRKSLARRQRSEPDWRSTRGRVRSPDFNRALDHAIGIHSLRARESATAWTTRM
jgi:hypothetical protein